MCTIAFAWQALADAPIAVAANRDEALDRESLPPRVFDDDPTVVAPQDVEAGGTWIGVSERGLLVAITNRWSRDGGAPELPAERSRGLLVRDALRAEDADAATALVREAVAEVGYAGFNLLVADAERATYVEWDGDLRVRDLQPGVHVIVNPGIDEADDRAVGVRDALAVGSAGPEASGPERSGAGDGPTADAGESRGPAADAGAGQSPSPGQGTGPGAGIDGTPTAAAWLDDAAAVLRDHDYEVCVHREQFGTRSSSLVSIDADGRATYAFADGPPCETAYTPLDLSVGFLDRRG